MSETTSVTPLPRGTWNAHLFQVFNSISFTVIVGTPVVLFFKHHGASATLLGVVLALSPLLNILQIPAAAYVERIGYRAFVLKGWTIRSFFIFGMAGFAVLPDNVISTGWRLGGVFALLVLFNATRGFFSCGFLPWMTAWIPEGVRGRFLSRDQMFTALAGAMTMLAMAAIMRGSVTNLKFGLVFLASYAGAIASLYFLRRIPDVPVTEKRCDGGRVPWKELLLYPPFRKFMIYNVVMCIVFGGAGVLWVPLLRDVCRASEGWVLGMGAASGGVMALTSLAAGPLADRTGSRPLLGMAGLLFIVHFLGWGAVAAGWWPLGWLTASYVCVTAGMAFGLFQLANMRLAMATVPVMGRSHFFALFSVINNLVLGIAPVAWGWGVDRLANWQAGGWGWEWNRFSVLYLAVTGVVVLGQVLLRQLTEARALHTEEFLYELVVRTPARGLSRLLSRRPLP